MTKLTTLISATNNSRPRGKREYWPVTFVCGRANHPTVFKPRMSFRSWPQSGSIRLHTRHLSPKLDWSSMTSEAHQEAELHAKEHILAGDIFQMRKIINQLLGTIRRGKTAKEDLVFEKEILNDEKKCAEHIILVDVQRNNVKKDIAVALRTINFPTATCYDINYSYKDVDKRRKWIAVAEMTSKKSARTKLLLFSVPLMLQSPHLLINDQNLCRMVSLDFY